jgi:polyisoprenoid-binding protein YceI
MTNYLAALAFTALIAGAACADDSHPPTNRLAAQGAPEPKQAASAAPAAQPAAANAAAPAAAGAMPSYRQTGGDLSFTFEQAGAASKGSFKQFATTLTYDERNPAAGKLDVKVQIASLDTQDKDRDSTLVSADLFDAEKFPSATYSGTLAKAGSGIEAVGKLTIRGVAKEVRLPLNIRATATGLELSGQVKIKRLDFGIGQGEWQSTEWVGDVVTISYKVALAKS